MSIILENIKQIADNEGVTITGLEKVLGASKGVLSRALANNSDIQAKWILKLVENYPQYNCEWLIKNEGPMIKELNIDNFQLNTSEVESELSYKELAASRKQTIDTLQKLIFYMEKQIETHEKSENNS
ncbi:hypothetical protein ASF10_19705 [Flavobacterium sp. Leaf82]|jgi:hypothetical protein|uniref:hypothetical protein n=1 Tax=unclassified Flavobacterium TaxID=196869 RepID=UPI0006F61C3A|nr:hypothetical protein [Flavobacterium sp. Leaf82]KQO33027.1 hypothetical protein ASF10_19705 [Flavobacterium sp. Leaf82]